MASKQEADTLHCVRSTKATASKHEAATAQRGALSKSSACLHGAELLCLRPARQVHVLELLRTA